MTSAIKNFHFTTPSCFSRSSNKHSATTDANGWLSNGQCCKLHSTSKINQTCGGKKPQEAIQCYIKGREVFFQAVVWPLSSLCDHLGFLCLLYRSCGVHWKTYPWENHNSCHCRNCTWLSCFPSALGSSLLKKIHVLPPLQWQKEIPCKRWRILKADYF